MPASDLVNLSGLMADAKCFAPVRQHCWPGGVRCPGCSGSIRHRVDRLTAIVTGEWSGNSPRQRWAASAISRVTLCTCSRAEQGGHSLMFKNLVKFTSDHRAFLER